MALNSKQIRAIELLVYAPKMTQNAIAEDVGVHRDTIRRWREETPEFKEALDKAIKERWKAAEAIAVNTMIEQCNNGNIQAAKFMLESMGYKPTEKIEAKVDAKAQVVFVDDLEAEKNEDTA
jgi:transposase-like protein